MSLKVASLDDARMNEYIARWTVATCSDAEEQQRVTQSFNKRRQEPHVKALAQNPMQLSVLLHFIRSQGEAFPDRRAELYRDYFKTVIDRDVEKTPRLRTLRGDIEALHQLVAFRLHSWAETERSSGSISRDRLITVVEEWLRAEDRETGLAKELFRIGEERLGLIVALTGEGGGTRYGFEIQPVREYFAAAYINERISGNAHDLFEAMARRSFWREVALLLAGLRRANEKADLLSRAKNLDDDAEFSWRQDGHNIVLELLQEGVLTSPGGVQRDAILLLLQALDPSDRQPRNEAPELLGALPGIMKACSAHAPLQVVERFLNVGESISDVGALERLYSVAYRTLGTSAMRQHLRGLEIEDSELSALRHIAWPDSSRLPLKDISRADKFWPEMTSRRWAAVWYATAVENSEKTALCADASYHPLLLECFAWNSIFPSNWLARRGQIIGPTPSPWAIWRLRDNLLFLSKSMFARQTKDLSVVPPQEAVDYSGLTGSLKEMTEVLIESSSEIAKHIDNRPQMLKSIDQFLLCVVDALELDGISGWVASRCAVSLIEAREAGVRGPYYTYIGPDGSEYLVSARSGSLGIDRLLGWRRLRQAAREFYRTPGTLNLRRTANEGFLVNPPDQIRIASTLRPVIPMLLDPREGADQDLPWLSSLPLPHAWLPSMLSVDRTRLPELLARLSTCHTFSGPSSQLSAPIIQKVLGLVRRTEDKAVCAGALVALLASRFWSLADNQTVLKMVRCDSEFSDIASRLFDFGSERDEQPLRRQEIAQAIVNGSIVSSRSTAVAAARYLAANAAFALPPLSSLPLFHAGKG